jgi:hypothetical protein
MIQGNPILRNLCSQLVSVFRAEENGPQPAISGNLEEIGESTALVLTENPIHPGTKVRIDCNMRDLRGVTESCEANEWLGFFVEIRLDADSRWSPQWFSPEHLCSAKTSSAIRTRIHPACDLLRLGYIDSWKLLILLQAKVTLIFADHKGICAL